MPDPRTLRRPRPTARRAMWLLAIVFLPGFSCYELGPQPQIGPTFEVGYLPWVAVEQDIRNIDQGTGFRIGGGLGTRRGGDIVLPEEFAGLAPSEAELNELLEAYPRGYQVGGDFQDWAAGSSLAYSQHDIENTDMEVEYWRLRIGAGGSLNKQPSRIIADVSLGETFHYLDYERGNGVYGWGLFTGLGLRMFPTKNLGLGASASAEAWWAEGGRFVLTYELSTSITFQFSSGNVAP